MNQPGHHDTDNSSFLQTKELPTVFQNRKDSYVQVYKDISCTPVNFKCFQACGIQDIYLQHKIGLCFISHMGTPIS